MKKQKLLAALAAVILFTSCNTGSADNAAEQSVTEASVQVTASVPETSAETTAETEAPAGNDTEPEYVEVSAGNEFIDFEFIENYQGTTEFGDLADKAVDFLKTTDFYAESMKSISEFSNVEFSDYIVDGAIVPKFRTAYPNDYDGDGRTETFIAVDMPVHYDNNILTSFYIYADSSENMTLLEVSGKPDENTVFLNYGRDKQIAFGGGLSPYGSVCYLYGVKDGNLVLLYSEQAKLEKRACFLRSHGFQAAEHFIYYDTAAREYRQIASVRIPNDELKALDTSGSLNSVFEEHGDNFSSWVTDGKYYFIKTMFEFADVYTYDNGTFTLMKDPPVGLNIPESFMPYVIDIDIDKAIDEMKPPVEPYAKVSEDNVFIDYRFIEDYQGTTDIGVLAAGAVEFLTESEYYAESTENIGEFTDEKFKKYFDESGNILPRLQTAYPEDYDGDGSTETFIIVDMPYMVWNVPAERSFLIFADSRGEMTLLSDASYLYKTIVLDYGDFKQITFGGYGTMGADDHTLLYGVVGGEVKKLYIMRGDFFKTNCFLTTIGWQSGGAFMYYDTTACEYRAISGIDVPIEKIKEMDSTNALSEFYEHFDKHGYLYAQFVGGRYYVLIRWVMDTGTAYLYENGEFIQTDECKYIRSC
ncbi:MAG: hypothetical protein K2K34_02125, partial [Oscillospiraceae bacterium]|nr:hypothetical protein [Oscillospiraceae bacterium]